MTTDTVNARPGRLRQLAAKFTERPRLQRELLLFGAVLLAGLLIVPIFIYLTGVLTLGAYGNGGFWTFMKDIFLGLGQGSAPVWIMIAGPYILLTLMRFTLFVFRRFAG